MSKTRIETLHSIYLIDDDEMTLVRTPVHKDANPLTESGLNGESKAVSNYYVSSEYDLAPANRLVVTYQDGTFSVSTEVLDIRELEDEEVNA